MADLAARIVAAVSLATWIYLAVGHGRFWRTSITLPRRGSDRGDPREWPSVTAIVPARNEVQVLPDALPTLLAQHYPGRFEVLLVDDDSSDGTGDLAARLGATVLRTTGPPAGWSGKVAAMAAGVDAAVAAGDRGAPDWLLFTDADIAYRPGVLTDLVLAGLAGELDLVSQMALLRAEGFWERWIVPAFVYFFAQLYPFGRVNGTGRTAAAAGGCMLVRRGALERAGGLEQIRSALIDDVSLARLLGRRGRLWLGVSREVRSVRAYPHLRELWSMVARSAYDQLRYSPILLAATVLGLIVVYLVPPAAMVVGAARLDPWLIVLGVAAWVIMAGTYLPMLRFYRLGWWRASALPLVAMLYAAMTLDSARRHRSGRGGEWKGRSR